MRMLFVYTLLVALAIMAQLALLSVAHADGPAFATPKFTSGDAQYPSLAACRAHYQALTGGCTPISEGSDSINILNSISLGGERFRRGTGCGSGASSCFLNQCNAGYVPSGAGKCVAAPTCGDGETYNSDTGMCESEGGGEGPDCTAGRNGIAPYATEQGSCVGGCYVDYGPVFQSPEGAFAQFTTTGQQCGLEIPDDAEEPADYPLCGESPDGDAICLGVPETDMNCGRINDQFVCLDSAPSGECHYLPGGSYVCATNPGESPAPSDIPDTGDGETPREPDLHGGDGIKEIHGWGPGAMESSQGQPAGGGGSGGGSGENAVTNDLLKGVAKETTLQAVLRRLREGLSIDEGSTSSEIGDPFGGAREALDDAEESIGLGVEVDAVELPDLGGIVPPACQQLTIEVQGENVTIPSAEGCDAMTALRNLLAWLFGMGTAIYIFRLAMKEPV